MDTTLKPWVNGMNWAYLESSSMTIIEFFLRHNGRPSAKSIDKQVHISSGIRRGCSRPGRDKLSIFSLSIFKETFGLEVIHNYLRNSFYKEEAFLFYQDIVCFLTSEKLLGLYTNDRST